MEISVVFPRDIHRLGDHDGVSIHPFSTFNSSTSRPREVWGIVAVGRNGEIGFRGDMPWHIPEDLRHFKELTLGHPVIMGRATWLSLPKRPLAGRRNIILSRDARFSAPGAERAESLEEAIAACPPPEIPVIIGGASVYESAMPLMTRIYVTRIDADFPDADKFFPEIDGQHWILTDRSETFTSKNGLSFCFETYESNPN